MSCGNFAARTLHYLRLGVTSIALFQFTIGASLVSAAPPDGNRSSDTVTPIKHVIVIIGENRSFDHVFATYKPKDGQKVWNLLSEGIVKDDGAPGPNFYKAAGQYAAVDTVPDQFLLNPDKIPFPNRVLPAPLVGGPDDSSSYIPNNDLTLAKESENGLPESYYPALVSGGALLPSKTPDTRIANVNSLPTGPFQITGPNFPYNNYAASPVHRFYQMWQQLDCSVEHATWEKPSGCTARLFPWVEVTFGAGSNGNPPASNFSTEYSSTAKTTGEGSTAMAFYNVQQGDAPYFKYLADKFSMSDNFHQSVDGGTGANHIMFGHADAIWFSDGNGNPLPPPHNVTVSSGPNAGTVDEVENPNPLSGTNNWYTEDGYGGGGYGSPSYGGGSYSECSDPTQPGVGSIVAYLKSLPRPIDPRCQPGHYYLLNNYNPGWFGNGNNAYIDPNPANTVFTIPPSSTPSIGDSLLAAHISWKYYGDQWDAYVPDPYQINYGAVGSENGLGNALILPGQADEYCNICNPFQYDTSIMSNEAIRTAHIQDTLNLYADIKDGHLPAVSVVKPSGFTDGHPASSKLNLFEGFMKKIIDEVAHSEYAKDTAIFITFDEGGGYYDSGYVQPLDFFGDGTRIPLMVVSAYSTGGHISHEYSDHVSIIKFIERNWKLGAITNRSRDNFPNPKTEWGNPYVPVNGPAISDLFDLFDFGHYDGGKW